MDPDRVYGGTAEAGIPLGPPLDADGHPCAMSFTPRRKNSYNGES